jgi:hypothetical protein
MQAIPKVLTQNRDVNQLQDNLGKAISDLNNVPFNSGILLQEIDLVVGDNTVYTTLPQVLTGWVITRQGAVSDIYDKQSTNTNPKTLILNSSAIVTVDVFVF